MKASENFLAAANIIEAQPRIHRGTMYGFVGKDQKKCYCAAGALHAAAYEEGLTDSPYTSNYTGVVHNVVQTELGRWDRGDLSVFALLVSFNDEEARDKREVVRTLRKIGKRLESKGL